MRIGKTARIFVGVMTAFAVCGGGAAFSQNRGQFEVFDILTATSPTASRSKQWKPGEGIAMEVGGMDWIGERLAVAVRKGEVWLLDGVLEAKKPEDVRYQLFASGLHEPLGVLADKGDLLVAQRAEITRLKDRDSDGKADAYLAEASGWGVSGNYHAYVYGPERDGEGNLWV
ncbi:MAG: hypothetical protein HKN23_17100, partial [Verrucomicrobiales bacterium]|nr:hypothetical protein [Verrucomicrobiales bacterium]